MYAQICQFRFEGSGTDFYIRDGEGFYRLGRVPAPIWKLGSKYKAQSPLTRPAISGQR